MFPAWPSIFLLWLWLHMSKISWCIFVSEKTNVHWSEYIAKGKHRVPVICQEKYFYIYKIFYKLYIYLSVRLCNILFILLLFLLRNNLTYSVPSHKFQAFLDNLTDGYYANIDSDYLVKVLYNLGNILEIRHHKRQETLTQSLYLISSLNFQVAEEING